MESVRAFAGEPADRAVFYPLDDRYLIGGERTVSHFDGSCPGDGDAFPFARRGSSSPGKRTRVTAVERRVGPKGDPLPRLRRCRGTALHLHHHLPRGVTEGPYDSGGAEPAGLVETHRVHLSRVHLEQDSPAPMVLAHPREGSIEQRAPHSFLAERRIDPHGEQVHRSFDHARDEHADQASAFRRRYPGRGVRRPRPPKSALPPSVLDVLRLDRQGGAEREGVRPQRVEP